MAAAHREATAGTWRPVGRRPAGHGGREHHPARTIQVAAQDVDGVDQPRRGRPELGRGGADASVDRSGGRRGDLAGHPANRVRTDARRHRHPLGRERCDRGDELVETGEMSLDVFARAALPVGGQHVGDRGQQQGVGCPDGSTPTRRPPRRSSTGGGRPPRPCRPAPGWPRCGRESRVRCTCCRSRRTGWPRAARGGRCGRGRGRARPTANRTRSRTRPGGAFDPRSTR